VAITFSAFMQTDFVNAEFYIFLPLQHSAKWQQRNDLKKAFKLSIPHHSPADLFVNKRIFLIFEKSYQNSEG
jgi:hypothetical protein